MDTWHHTLTCTVDVDFDFFYPATADDTRQRERDSDFNDLVQAEDVAICEHAQRGLTSGLYFARRLNPRRENGAHHFHELWRRALLEQS